MEPHSPIPNWLELPVEVTAVILRKLGTVEILEVAQWVCISWYRMCKNPSMWRSISIASSTFSLPEFRRQDRICRHAVDRSCGQLNDINLKHFVIDELLGYIADRAPQLRSIRLEYCDVNGKVVGEVTKRLPNLEELHMNWTTLRKEILESIGHCCPQLKSLTYNKSGLLGPHRRG